MSILAREDLSREDSEEHIPKFSELSENEQNQIIKKKIVSEINVQIRNYLLQTNTFDYENAYHNFMIWLLASQK